MDNDDKDFMRDRQEVAAAHLAGIGTALSEGRFSALGAVQAASQFTSVVEKARQFAAGLPRFDASLAASSHVTSIVKSARLYASGLSRGEALLASASHVPSIVENARLYAAGLSRIGTSLLSASHATSIAEKAMIFAAGLPRFDPSFVTSSHAASITEKSRLFAASLSRGDIPRLSITQLAAIENALSNFGKVSAEMLSDAVNDSLHCESFDEISLSSLDMASLESDLNDSIVKLDQVKDRESYLSLFKSLPKSVKLFFYYLFMFVLLPHAVNISSNLLTPVVESYIGDENLTQREKIKGIKYSPLGLEDFDTKGLRFITGNYVRLRLYPSIKSEILGELMLGQVVTVVSKNKNWIEVVYECEDGTLLTGWVFTRYTSRFVR